jgi:hypothetical protein
MNGQDYVLTPFPGTGRQLGLELRGQMSRCGVRFELRFELWGRLAAVALPARARVPARRYGLWEDTCFEFFLALRHSPEYWEFNLSPAGHWNVYNFSGYRQGMQEAGAFTALPFAVRRGRDSLVLGLELDLNRIIPADQALEAALAAVIKLRDGQRFYWALSHPGPHPDFHRRDAFSIEL